jgi:uncharacterized membrane protein YdjX (TVP38/TMEM64 family)
VAGADEEKDGRRRLITVMVVVTVISLVGFAIVEWIDPPFLAEDVWMSGEARPWVALVGVGLLLADLVLPVPSSVVMIFLGRVLGFPAGAALSWLATIASALVAFAIGRRMRRGSVPESLDRRLRAHGVLVVAITRPVPVLAETTAVAAGMVPAMTWRRMLIGTVAGTAPPALVFAAAGAWAHGTSGALLIGACLLIDIAVWYVERTYRRRREAVGARSVPSSPDSA